MLEQHYSAQEAFNPQLRAENARWNTYIGGRPYQDESGLTHSPDGELMGADAYFDNRRDVIATENVESYDSMSMPKLARKLALAEYNKDTTSATDISDILIDKMAGQADMIRSERDPEHSNEREDNLWNRIMNIKNDEHERLMSELSKDVQAKQITEVATEGAETPAVAEVPEVEVSGRPVTPEKLKYSLMVGHAEKVENGEDRVVIDPQLQYFAVVDGMGGPGNGDIAADTISYNFHNFWRERDSLIIDETNAADLMRSSIVNAQEGLDKALDAGLGHEGMGGVATQIKFFQDSDGNTRIVYGHVGDTRLYMQSELGEEPTQITADECLPEPFAHKVANAFTAGRTNGGAQALQIGISEPLKIGTRFLLCTDGITGDTTPQQISPKTMAEAFDSPDVQAAAEKLLDASTKPDDGNVVFIEIAKLIESRASENTQTFAEANTTEAPVLSRRQRARAFMGGLLTSGKEKSKRNKAVVAFVAGALALGALASLESNNDDKESAVRAGAKPAVTASPTMRPTAQATLETTQLKVAPVKLVHGDTIWNEAATNLKQNVNALPTNLQILNETNRILKLNHLTWDKARHLADDTQITE